MNGAAIATAGIVVGSTLLRTWQNDKIDRPAVSFKAVTAGFLLGAIISAVAMADNGLATGLAILICISTILLNIDALTSAGSREPTAATAARTVVSHHLRSHVPVITYGSATHAFVSRQTERTDVRRLADLGGVDAKELAALLPTIPDRHWLYLHKGSARGVILTRVEIEGR